MNQTQVMRADQSTRTDARKFFALQFVRILLTWTACLFLARTIDFGVHVAWLLSSATFGTIAAGAFLSRGRKFIPVLLGHLLVALILTGGFNLANAMVISPEHSLAAYDFLIPRIADSVFILGLFYGVSFLATWFFWTMPQAVTFEAVVISSAFLWLLGGHRNYHIDAPKQISSLSWKVPLFQRLQLEPQHIFLGLGVSFILLLGFYFVLASNRPLFGKRKAIKNFGPSQKFAAITCPLLILVGLFYYAKYINSQYSADLSRVSNGVGTQEGAKEGESNLGFHSAVSSTKQPSALVRLENDFTPNPWEPMVYFREGALSSFNGRELVFSGMNYDTDVPQIAPGQPYVAGAGEPEPTRTKVVQSIYLLTDHKVPFAIDTPRQMRMIKNPYPERFRLAYQALSHAPTAKLEELIYEKVGDASWSKETWDHYLRAPGSRALQANLDSALIENALQASDPVPDENGEDLRYLALSKKLTEGNTSKVIQAAAIVQYLSEQSIYTRKPGHQVTDKGDPVAPYLFSEKMRGYCVHFAHAATYLMRLAGIPARIATGYLVDLTYAKDGHILLHLGDRHAWPEVYIEGHGWTVFDITPAQAENEQALVPDENLLDELMSKLDPAQEILEPIPMDPTSEKENQILAEVFRSRNVVILIAFLLLSWLGFKSWLRFSHYLPATSENVRLKRAYIAFASLLSDSGFGRYEGETRTEYARRLEESLAITAGGLTAAQQQAVYRGSVDTIGGTQLEESLRELRQSYDQRFSKLRRFLCFFSPLSISRWRSW